MDHRKVDKFDDDEKILETIELSQSPNNPKIDPKEVVSSSFSSNEVNSGPFVMESPKSQVDSPLKTAKSVTWSSELTSEAPFSRRSDSFDNTANSESNSNSNTYASAPLPPSQQSASSRTVKDTVSTMKDVLGKWGKRVGETSKKGQDLAGNVWQHLKTGPSFADAAMGRIAQGTKVLAEGGYEKIFQQTFETVPEEKLQRTYACYLSTSAGPVMGVLYISTVKLAFCSDNPLPYKVGEQNEWSYYKVVIPLHQLKEVNTSISKVNRAEKYIQVISVDNHEFWFMGFVNYDSAVKYLQDALQARNLQSG